jgi:hypothetical protein
VIKGWLTGLGAAFNSTGSTKAAALALAHTAPDPELLAVIQGVLETVLTSDATSADFLGFTG